MKKPILVIEDEINLLHILKLNLEYEGYEVSTAENGILGMQEILSNKYEAVILDIMLPKLDGFEVLKEIRSQGITTPILALSARSITADKILGLKLGANDYLSKPFEIEELVLRLKNLIATNPNTFNIKEDKTYTFLDFNIDFNQYQIMNPQKKFKKILSQKEAAVLHYFFKNEGIIINREQFINTIWGYNANVYNRTLDNIILNFRKIFEANPKSPQYFTTIRSIGFKFESFNQLHHA
ncbi:MAG: response regulator transcription factor [Alphaproteobacteria bacterium]|nr:response regulator transcription factor [Alphaproteobacteria bacterium]